MSALVLSLFPGIGLLDMAFEEAGFCVVRGPDLLWGGDIRTFSPPSGRFDGVIGGPPCQAFSRLRHIVEAKGLKLKPNLIPEFVRCIEEAQPAWWVMENVLDAPVPMPNGYRGASEVVCDGWCGGETQRTRRISFGSIERRLPFHIETLALHRPDLEPAALASGGTRRRPVAIGGSGKRKDRGALANRGFKTQRDFDEHCRLQGLPPDFLKDAPFSVAGKIRVRRQRRAARHGAGHRRGRAPGDGVCRNAERRGMSGAGNTPAGGQLEEALGRLMVTSGRCACRTVPLPRELMDRLREDAEALVYRIRPDATGETQALILFANAALALISNPDRAAALAALREARSLVAAIRAGEVPSHLDADPGDRTWPGAPDTGRRH